LKVRKAEQNVLLFQIPSRYILSLESRKTGIYIHKYEIVRHTWTCVAIMSISSVNH